jgi:Mg/Co/Ni transporter MgtE
MPDATIPRLEFETAAEHLCRNVPVLSPSASADQARAMLIGKRFGLPWVISRLGGDPAFGSGPLATVIQDLLSILIYLGIGSAVLR